MSKKTNANKQAIAKRPNPAKRYIKAGRTGSPLILPPLPDVFGAMARLSRLLGSIAPPGPAYLWRCGACNLTLSPAPLHIIPKDGPVYCPKCRTQMNLEGNEPPFPKDGAIDLTPELPRPAGARRLEAPEATGTDSRKEPDAPEADKAQD